MYSINFYPKLSVGATVFVRGHISICERVMNIGLFEIIVKCIKSMNDLTNSALALFSP